MADGFGVATAPVPIGRSGHFDSEPSPVLARVREVADAQRAIEDFCLAHRMVSQAPGVRCDLDERWISVTLVFEYPAGRESDGSRFDISFIGTDGVERPLSHPYYSFVTSRRESLDGHFVIETSYVLVPPGQLDAHNAAIRIIESGSQEEVWFAANRGSFSDP